MTKKGLKMNISKCLKKNNIHKSLEKTTEIRGVHEFTKGYSYIELDDDNEVILYWHDDSIGFEERLKIMENIYTILNNYGFSEYMKFSENVAQITLINYSD